MTINSVPVPRFYRTATGIASDFLDNPGFSGNSLPPVRQLAEKYGVSKGTVEKALAWLEERGRITGEVGRGTFIVRAHASMRPAVTRLLILSARHGLAPGHYLNSITQGIQEYALKRRLPVVSLSLDPVMSRRRIALERGRLVEPGTGALVIHADPSIQDLLEDLDAASCPFVLVGNGHFPARTKLGLDDADGIRQVMKHLAEHGRTKPVFLGTDGKQSTHQARREAFEELRKGNPGWGASLCRGASLTLAGGHALAGEALAQHPDLDALVCVNDRLALGAVIRLRESGKRIPEDVAVTGFDNDPTLVEDFLPPLTSVGYDGRELGRRALLALLGETVDPLLPVKLVVRGSTEKKKKEKGV